MRFVSTPKALAYLTDENPRVWRVEWADGFHRSLLGWVKEAEQGYHIEPAHMGHRPQTFPTQRGAVRALANRGGH